MDSILDLGFLADEVIGNDFSFQTPFGTRLMTYADYVASGRSLKFIEKYLLHIQRSYANVHTEDNVTGRNMTRLIKEAEKVIKRAFNAEDNCYVFPIGTGATGAISKLQEILGLYAPPATMERFQNILTGFTEENKNNDEVIKRLISYYKKNAPIVFIGPYEHHSNDIIWREFPMDVIEIKFNNEDELDLDDLEQKVSDPRYTDRFKIGSFSACSNITGLLSPVYKISQILHKHDVIACFDFAASAPYINIDMNKDDDSYIDALALSPHKFIGGPGSSGILIMNKKLYRPDLTPTRAAGGTVDYVGLSGYDFMDDPEAREKAGTPGALQIIKAALCIDIKNAVGIENIERIENNYKNRAFQRFRKNPNIEILGSPDQNKRITIFSLLLKHKDRYLHHKFATSLLNDLFGIQTRAGCSCAGPYGHRLLQIGPERSELYREAIQRGFLSIKPGWVRLNFHYVMNENDFDFICKAVDFVATNGYLFIPEYEMGKLSGSWAYKGFKEPAFEAEVSIKSILDSDFKFQFENQEINRKEKYQRYLLEAERIAEKLRPNYKENFTPFDDSELESLSFFYVTNLKNSD